MTESESMTDRLQTAVKEQRLYLSGLIIDACNETQDVEARKRHTAAIAAAITRYGDLRALQGRWMNSGAALTTIDEANALRELEAEIEEALAVYERPVEGVS